MINNYLEQWVKGNPVHDHQGGECCPDFSCCKPHLLATEEERKEFVLATPARRASMLMIFLDRMLSGEVEQGTAELYKGKNTGRAIKARLTKEKAHGDRWARAMEYSHENEWGLVGIDLER